MIYTVTLNPALDHFIEVDGLVVDDANRVKGECLYAGGKSLEECALRGGGGDRSHAGARQSVVHPERHAAARAAH